MKKIHCWEIVLVLFLLSFTLVACGDAAEPVEESAPAMEEEPAAEEPAAEEPAPEEEPAQEAGSSDSLPDTGGAGVSTPEPVPTAAQAEPTPTVDFGSVAYDVPTNMVRSEEVQIILFVSPSEDEDELEILLEEELGEVGQEPGNVKTATVEIAKRMSASLTSAPAGAFEIVPLQASEKQLLRENEPTQWEWTVVPLLGGTHRLILRIDRLVERDGVLEPLKEEVHRDDVTVEVPAAMRLQDAVGGFDIKWLAGVFIFPLFFYILSRRGRKSDRGE